MNRLSHQPKVLVLGAALAFGFAMLGAGCTQGNDDAGKTSSMANAGSSSHGAGMGDNHAGSGQAGSNGGMSAGRGNSTQPVSDTWITTKVKTALATMDKGDNTDIDVETNNGVVTLTGTAASDDSVQAMASAARQVKGVTQVNTSGVQVGSASSGDDMRAGIGDSQHPVKDTWITTKVSAALHTVDGLDNGNIEVETNNGVVSLMGHVDSQEKADAAVAEVKTIKHVKSVDTSRLEVGGGSNK